MADGVDAAGLSPLGQAALWYAENGFGVFPLGGRAKEPATAHGVNDWTDDPETIAAWWSEHPKSNIGIACGQPSNGLLVFDIDVSDNKRGMQVLKDWQKVHGELPETAESVTGSGGRHIFYRTDRTNIHLSVNRSLGIDIRSDGGYVVAPPSVHPNGEPYEWWADPRDVGIATADGSVYDFLDFVQRNYGDDGDGSTKPNGKFKLPDEILKGERDTILFKYAAHLRAIGRSDEEIMMSVSGANATRCADPLDAQQIGRIVRSACRYERGDDESPAEGHEVGKPGAPDEALKAIVGPRGGVSVEGLGSYLLGECHASIIDGAPAIWADGHWSFGTAAIRQQATRAASKAGARIRISDKNEVLSYVRDMSPQKQRERSFRKGYYVQFSNCTWDVEAEEAVEPEPDMYIIGRLPIALDRDVPYGLADRFIDSLANGHEGVREVLCEIIGACMCGAKVVDQAPMLVGRANDGVSNASNGKSTFINWVSSIVGTENTSSISIGDMDNRFSKANVAGKLLNTSDDIADGFLRGEQLATFKKMVTGDKIFTDVKGGDGYTFRPSATQMFSMNQIPRMSDISAGTLRRLCFVPFYNHFAPGLPGYDPDIEAKLCEDGNLRRGALLGLQALPGLIERRHFTDIPEMRGEIDAVRADNNSTARWVSEEGKRPEEFDGKLVVEVYAEYKSWAADAGERYVSSLSSFSRDLMACFGVDPGSGRVLKTRQKKLDGRNRKAYTYARP